MKKVFSISAIWRKKDVLFINGLKTSKKIEEGFCVFQIEEGEDYNKLVDYYSKKDALFYKTKPKEFKVRFIGCNFSKEDLDNAKFYAVQSFGGEPPESRYPHPYKDLEYQTQVFRSNRFEFGKTCVMANKEQIAPFKIKKTKWKKNEVCFSLGLEYEYTCFKKEFFRKVLAPLGLQCMEVLDYKTGKPLEDTVQLITPPSVSKLLLENSSYDIHSSQETNGFKQYAVQTLDFFPPFEKEFDFHICYSQEDFYIGHKKIIISKEFCNLLVEHKIIKYASGHLIPMKSFS